MTEPGPVAAPAWWNERFFFRQQVTLSVTEPLTFTPEVTTLLAVTLDTAALVGEGRLRADGDDLRIVYRDEGAGWRELPRSVEGPNAPTSTVRFPLQATISDTSERYYLYYGNAVAEPAAEPVEGSEAWPQASYGVEETPVVTATLWAGEGGVLVSAEGTLTATFFAEAITQTLVVTHTPHRASVTLETGTLSRFDLSAATVGGEAVTRFSPPISLTYDYERWGVSPDVEPTITFQWWDEGAGGWTPLSSTVALTPDLVYGETDHLSDLRVFVAGSGGYTTTTRAITYTYDPLSRLIEADYSTPSTGSGQAGESYEYQYDAVGNRLAMTSTIDHVSRFTPYEYDAADRLTSVGGVGYTYDSNGNLLDDGTRTFTYDTANRLTQVVVRTESAPSTFTTTYTYSGDGTRLAQTVNGATTRYVVDVSGQLPHVLEERSDGHTVRYLYGAGVMGVETNGALLYQHGDALGSVRQLTDEAGSVRQARGYSPFGAPTSAAGQSAGSFGFAGEQYDAASGLIFLRARYYDPTTGRFLTRDTYPALAPVPQSLHRYVYCGNDPVNRTDPSGQHWKKDRQERTGRSGKSRWRPGGGRHKPQVSGKRVEDGGGKGSKDDPPPPPQSDTGHRGNAYEMRKRFEANPDSRAIMDLAENGDLRNTNDALVFSAVLPITERRAPETMGPYARIVLGDWRGLNLDLNDNDTAAAVTCLLGSHTCQSMSESDRELYETLIWVQEFAGELTVRATSIGLRVAPLTGDFIDIVESFTATDFVTGEPLTYDEWLMIPAYAQVGILTAGMGRIGQYGDEFVELMEDAPRMMNDVGAYSRIADDVEDAGRVVLELGSGNFANLPRIVAENPGARVIGTEIPGVERWLEFARRHPGESSDFDELLEGYEAATSAGAEIWFLDYRDLPASFADEVISIAPYPGLGARGEDLASAVETAGVMAHVIKPGGRIYVAADTIFAARDVTEELGRRLDVAIEPTKLVPVPYVSEYLRHREGAYWAHEIEVISP